VVRIPTNYSHRKDSGRTRPRLLVAGATFSLACLLSGCGASEPQVATDVPEVKIAEAPDYTKGKSPKGMPKNTTAGMKLDPATGRPKPE